MKTKLQSVVISSNPPHLTSTRKKLNQTRSTLILGAKNQRQRRLQITIKAPFKDQNHLKENQMQKELICKVETETLARPRASHQGQHQLTRADSRRTMATTRVDGHLNQTEEEGSNHQNTIHMVVMATTTRVQKRSKPPSKITLTNMRTIRTRAETTHSSPSMWMITHRQRNNKLQWTC